MYGDLYLNDNCHFAVIDIVLLVNSDAFLFNQCNCTYMAQIMNCESLYHMCAT